MQGLDEVESLWCFGCLPLRPPRMTWFACATCWQELFRDDREKYARAATTGIH